MPNKLSHTNVLQNVKRNAQSPKNLQSRRHRHLLVEMVLKQRLQIPTHIQGFHCCPYHHRKKPLSNVYLLGDLNHTVKQVYLQRIRWDLYIISSQNFPNRPQIGQTQHLLTRKKESGLKNPKSLHPLHQVLYQGQHIWKTERGKWKTVWTCWECWTKMLLCLDPNYQNNREWTWKMIH